MAEDQLRALVGILVLDGGWIDQLDVEPAAIGRGIGGRPLAVAKHERPDGLRLWTFSSNPRTQNFYERHGFVEVDRTDSRDTRRKPPTSSTSGPGTVSPFDRLLLL